MSTVVLASAGTGKTHTLVDAWLRALLGLDDAVKGGDAGALLAITFTERAAAEMRTRIERRLADLRFAPQNERELVDSFAARGRAVPTVEALDALRRSIARAPIGTFHAMCARILREHALAAGIDPSFQILAADDEQRMLFEIAEATVIDALAHGDPVVAGLVARFPLRGIFQASGLVEALVAVHGSLAEQGVAAVDVVAADACLSVDAAVDAVEGALRAIAGSGARNVQARLQPAHARLQALQQVRAGAPGAIDDDGDAEAALARLHKDLQAGVAGNWGGNALTDKRRALVDAIEALGAALVDDHGAVVAARVGAFLVELDQRQRAEKDQRAVLGFGDLLTRTRELLRDNRSVRARVKARFEKIFVDEYQDTSPAQEEIVALLAEEPARGARLPKTSSRTGAGPLAHVVVPRGRLFVVGDPKQSIYGFRGADSGVFARAVRALTVGDEERTAPVADLRRLTTSRRSSPAVCAFVNVVTGVVLPAHRGEELVPLAGIADGPCGAWWRPGPLLVKGAAAAVDVEAAIVADRVVDLLLQNEPVRAGHAPCAPGDIAVLVRRGRAAAVVGQALAARGVPVRVVGGDGFWRRPEILDLVSALALVVDPHDDLSALALLRSPLVAAPDDQILAIFEALPDGPSTFSWPAVVAAVDDDLVDRAVAARVRAFDALLQSMRTRLSTEPLTRCLDLLLDEGGYAVACAVEADADLRLRHVEKLRALCAGRPEDGVLLVARLVEAIDHPPPEPVVFDAPAGLDAVRVMTIHQAKGLEADVVVLADAGTTLRGDTDDIAFDVDVGLAVAARGRPIARCVPRSSSTVAPALQRVRRARRARDEAELARLLYVALTRARRGIFVVGEPRRGGGTSLLGLLDGARNACTAAFDALLAPIVVDAVEPTRMLSVRGASTQTVTTAATPAPVVRTTSSPTPQRLRASSLWARSDSQLSMGLPLVGAGDEHDDDVLPPRARGRLAHAVVALVASEMPDALDTAADARAAVVRALAALGAPAAVPGAAAAVDGEDAHEALVDERLIDALVRTLRGPVRALRDEGRVFSFEEPVMLVTDVAVVEGVADLVARGADDTVVVEWKLSSASTRAPAAVVQVQACCAALEQAGRDEQLRFAVWVIGDLHPPPSSPWGRVAKRELATVLARLGGARDR
jgi:ATP-dependent helicase/nuclease subunit A